MLCNITRRLASLANISSIECDMSVPGGLKSPFLALGEDVRNSSDTDGMGRCGGSASSSIGEQAAIVSSSSRCIVGVKPCGVTLFPATDRSRDDEGVMVRELPGEGCDWLEYPRGVCRPSSIAVTCVRLLRLEPPLLCRASD